MWQKIKDNLLSLAISAYFLFWGYLIISSYVYYKIYEKNPSLAQKKFSGNWKEVIFESVVFTTLSVFLIFVLIRKKKAKILKTLSYFLVPLIFIFNIFFTIILINVYSYTYVLFGNQKNLEQFFAKYNPNNPVFIYGHNFLHASIALKRNEEIVKFFIDKGADVNNVNYNGFTPLYYAVVDNSPEAVDLLIKQGANVNFQPQNKGNKNFSILTYAVISKRSPEDKEKIVELLLNAGVDINLKDSYKKTAFAHACLIDNNKDDDFMKDRLVSLRTIEMLLEAGANPFLKTTPEDLSQYEVAQKFKNTELIELFEKYKNKLK